MCNLKSVFLSVLLGAMVLIPISAMAEYSLGFKTPPSVRLQLVDNQEDASGYVRRYKVLSNNDKAGGVNMLTLTHDINVKFTPKQAMQEVVQSHRVANCAQKNAAIVTLSGNSIVFKTLLGQCSNGISLLQFYKAFSTPNGQYAINYSAQPGAVSQKTRHKMQELVKTAKLVSS